MPCDTSTCAVVVVCNGLQVPEGVGVAAVGPPLGLGMAPPGMWTQPLLAITAPNKNAVTSTPRSVELALVMAVTVAGGSFTGREGNLRFAYGAPILPKMEGISRAAAVPEDDPREARRLWEVRRFDVFDTPAEAEFDRFVRIAALACRAPVAMMTIVGSDQIWIKAKVGIDVGGAMARSKLCDLVLRERKGVVAADLQTDPRLSDLPFWGALGLHSCCGVALRTTRGAAVGALCVLDRNVGSFGPQHVEVLHEVASAIVHELEVRLAVRQGAAESRLRRIAESQRARAERDARTDALTGLRNRRALEADLVALERVTPTPEGVVAVLDVDGLKAVNDAGGHAAGDRYLRDFADELRTYFRGTDGLYRVGGDEFALLLRSAGLDPDHVRERLAWVVDRLRSSGRLRAGASIGVAAFSPAAGTPRNALGTADRSMYDQKRRKRTRQGAAAVSE